MKLFHQIDRMQYMLHLIQQKKTGNPEKFAKRLSLRKRQLFSILEELRIIGLNIQYSKEKQSYYYADDNYMEISYGVKLLSDEETKDIEGGTLKILKCIFFAPNLANFAIVNTFQGKYRNLFAQSNFNL